MAKREYQDYPSRFISIVEHFENTHDEIKFDLIYREAVPLRQAFYRFIQALALASSGGDEYAKRLHTIGKTLSVSLVPARGAPDYSPIISACRTIGREFHRGSVGIAHGTA